MRLLEPGIGLLLLGASTQAGAGFLPELPFCPFGGPPGWVNRLLHDRDDYNPPPADLGHGYPDYRYRPYLPGPAVHDSGKSCVPGYACYPVYQPR